MTREQKIYWAIIGVEGLLLTAMVPAALLLGVWLS
jgi:hypothetical protein